MKFPEPPPGLVIRYSFLWKADYDEEKYEASKDRPCAIVLAAKVKDTAATQVVVIPITHSEPDPADASASLEMPAAVAKSIGGTGCD
ncbi:UNVERIFIED_ORG: mRNA-degrading endonuclease toxin of MazEF toxin-antitoxin module [Rhizobium esperanzae]